MSVLGLSVFQFLLWSVSVLYIASALYFRVRYPWLHISMSLALFWVGATAFVAANTHVFYGFFTPVGTQVGMVGGLVLAWVFAVWAIHVQISVLTRIRESTDDV